MQNRIECIGVNCPNAFPEYIFKSFSFRQVLMFIDVNELPFLIECKKSIRDAANKTRYFVVGSCQLIGPSGHTQLQLVHIR